MKKLPINDTPILDTYNFECLPYSIISTKNGFRGWEANNYLLLVMQKNFINKPVPFGYYLPDYRKIPGLDCITGNRELINNLMNTNIIDFIKKAINNNWYIYLNLNDYFVPNKKSYCKEDNSHDSLIYGIDENEENIFLFGYTKNNRLERTSISFKNFVNAYYSLEKFDTSCDQFEMFRINDKIEYFFNKELFLDTLRWYSKGTNISKYSANYIIPEELVYGADCYDKLIEYYKLAKSNKVLNKFHNFKIPNKIVEHKKSLYQSVNYINKNICTNKLELEIEECRRLIKLSEELKVLTLKYSFDSSEKYLNACIDSLNLIKNIELQLIEKIIKKLEK